MSPRVPGSGTASSAPGDFSPRAEAALVHAPIALMVVFGALFYVRHLRPFGNWMLGENHPIELLTFGTLMAGGVVGLVWAREAERRGHGTLVASLCVLFSIGLLLTAMEEVAWGQWFFHFPTPAWFRANNAQGELTLHNIRGMQNHTEFLRLTFGLGGLVGAWALGRTRLRALRTPRVLLTWFIVISAFSVVDVYHESRPFGMRLNRLIDDLAEVIEMMIGISGLLYTWLALRRTRASGVEAGRGTGTPEAQPITPIRPIAAHEKHAA